MPTMTTLDGDLLGTLHQFLTADECRILRTLSRNRFRRDTMPFRKAEMRAIAASVDVVAHLVLHTVTSAELGRDRLLWRAISTPYSEGTSLTASLNHVYNGDYIQVQTIWTEQLFLFMSPQYNYFSEFELFKNYEELRSFLINVRYEFTTKYVDNLKLANDCGFHSLNFRCAAFVQDCLLFDDIEIRSANSEAGFTVLKAEGQVLFQILERCTLRLKRTVASGNVEKPLFPGRVEDAQQLEVFCDFLKNTVLTLLVFLVIAERANFQPDPTLLVDESTQQVLEKGIAVRHLLLRE